MPVGGRSRIGTGGSVVPELLDQLCDDRLLELVDIEGQLHVLVCGNGTVRRFPAGTTEQAAREVRFARFVLKRLAYGPAAPSPEEVHHRLARMGETLERVLLGEAAAHLGDAQGGRRTARKTACRAVGLLPHLRSRAVSVAPSAASWLRAKRAALDDIQNPAPGAVVLVRGPGLASQGAEVPRLAAEYAGEVEPVVLGDGTATAARVWMRSTVRGWCISRLTAPSALTARCSPRCASTTAR